VKLVEEEEISLTQAAKNLGLKHSTAKLIISRYRKTGTFFYRKEERQKLN
jgi:transposase